MNITYCVGFVEMVLIAWSMNVVFLCSTLCKTMLTVACSHYATCSTESVKPIL